MIMTILSWISFIVLIFFVLFIIYCELAGIIDKWREEGSDK